MSERTSTSGTTMIRLVLYWAIVGIPLAWGIYNTAVKAAALFG